MPSIESEHDQPTNCRHRWRFAGWYLDRHLHRLLSELGEGRARVDSCTRCGRARVSWHVDGERLPGFGYAPTLRDAILGRPVEAVKLSEAAAN